MSYPTSNSGLRGPTDPPPEAGRRIVAALSGGVDSAVAAARLVRAGHEVVGVHLRTGVEDAAGAAGGRSCCGADDARDARAVAAHLGIPFYVADVKDAFSVVIAGFVRGYAEGSTPNPCVECNRSVKFGRLREIARGLGADVVATGHYARVERGREGRVRLLAGIDERKDQSYVLSQLSQSQLAEACFPLGRSTKEEVRREADALGLPVARKPDSQELCFVPTGDYRGWFRENAPEAMVPGEIVDEDGTALGRHDGAAGFTVGQRRGLPPVGSPRYVASIDAGTGRVAVAARERLLRSAVLVERVNWIDVEEPSRDSVHRVRVRVRHAAPLTSGTLTALGGGRAHVALEAPVFAPAPGQVLVAYVFDVGVFDVGVFDVGVSYVGAAEAVLCGGTIASSAGP